MTAEVARHQLGRRGFMLGGAGVVFAFLLPGMGLPRRAAAATADVPLGAWIRIEPDNSVSIAVGSSEMGQGVLTSLAQIVAEELTVDWSTVTAQHSPAGPAWGNPAYGGYQVTGGSFSVRGYYSSLRTAGAAVRQVLMQSAANQWGVPLSQVVAAHGVVSDTSSPRMATYAALAPAAAALPLPTDPILLPSSAFTLIGTSPPRVDIPSKVDGTAVFGADIRLPGMMYAAVKHCKTIGGTVKTMGKPGSGLRAVNLGTAVAVIAPTWWAAFSAVSSLSVTWTVPSASSQMDDTVITSQAVSLMASPTGLITAESAGDAASAVNSAPIKINSTYTVPFLPHAALEPVVCTTLVTASSCTMWAPTQSQTSAVATAAALTGLPTSSIALNTTLIGGALGRKLEMDFIRQSVQIAMAVPGVPVQLMWPRREDFAHDPMRPMARVNVQAGVDSTGTIAGFWTRIVTPSILAQKGQLSGPLDDQAVEGAVAQPYVCANRLVEWVPHPATVPLGFWRSVGHSFNAFAVESAMDELAAAAGKDPLAFRLANLPAGGRHATVLRAAATLAGWGTVPTGHAQGLALHECFGTVVALVVEISRPTSTTIKVHRAAVAVDCGQAINPDGVVAQMESGVVHGLNAALFGRIKLTKGVPSPTNFDQFRMLRISQMPQVNVTIVDTGAPLGGAGEPGSPPVAPAISNAWFRLTKKRLRATPMF